MEEITGLGSDLSAGLRASARAILNAEEGVRGAGKFMNSVVVPSVKQKVPEARGKSFQLYPHCTHVKDKSPFVFPSVRIRILINNSAH